jgi:hypothetical protein
MALAKRGDYAGFNLPTLKPLYSPHVRHAVVVGAHWRHGYRWASWEGRYMPNLEFRADLANLDQTTSRA